MDACVSVDGLESWEKLSMDGTYLEAGLPMHSLAWVAVEAALGLYQSLEVRSLNRFESIFWHYLEHELSIF